MADTVFHKIIKGEIPAQFEYQDEDCVVIKDINPKAPVHLLVIPKKDLESLKDAHEADQQLLGKLLFVAKKMTEKFSIQNAFKIKINNGSGAGQEVMQLHIHVLGGRTRSAAE